MGEDQMDLWLGTLMPDATTNVEYMPSPFEKAVLVYEEERLGRFSQVVMYKSADESLTIPVASASSSPEAGLSTYATIGLSQFDNGLTSESGNRIGIELLVTGREENTFLASGLANAALNIASGGYQAKPGIIFPGIFDGYGPDITTPHGLLWYPFAWDKQFDGLSRDGVDVEWLLVIPVSDDEVSFIAANGPGFEGAGVEKLIDTFESDAVDIYDTGRSSAV